METSLLAKRLLSSLSPVPYVISILQYEPYQLFTATQGVNVRRDSDLTGPPVEEVHYHYDQCPNGLAISKHGWIFFCHTRGTYVSERPCLAKRSQ